VNTAVTPSTTMWGFPKAKPQFFSPSPFVLGAGMCCYSFGRRLPRWQQSILATQALVPLGRNAFLAHVDSFEPACGWEQWREWEQWLRRREARVARWVHVRSQWSKSRSSMLGLGRTAEPHVFVTVEPRVSAILHPNGGTTTFNVPSLRDETAADCWLLRSFDAVPRFHKTPRWDPALLATVANEASTVLEDELIRPANMPLHWRPMHGDFVPWNLREDRSGLLWLLDWEDVGWAPPNADLLRYAVAFLSIYLSNGAQIAEVVRKDFPSDLTDSMTEAAIFWTTHPNLQRPSAPTKLSKGQMSDFGRSRLEYDALLQIARA
jgi:hypothetical protein